MKESLGCRCHLLGLTLTSTLYLCPLSGNGQFYKYSQSICEFSLSVCVLFLKHVHRYRNCTRTGLNFRGSYTSGCSLGAWQLGEGHRGVLGLYLLGGFVLKVTIATQGLTGAWTKPRVRSIQGEDNEGENGWMSE